MKRTQTNQMVIFEDANQRPLPFILRQLEVVNWGPFGGRHRADIDPAGTAIIGPTGSGKTTLVDALMTLITSQPKYNLASTGGHESDRDLISYIRGVSGAGNNSGDNRHVARPGKTITAISACFANEDHRVQIGALFWINGPSFSPSDRKDLWMFTERDDQSLEQWLDIFKDGGARALKQYGRQTAKLQIFDTKKAFTAQLRRFFEVGTNAFTLLNRAAGLKQLNSIDEVFREWVLDDRSAFERAAEVAKEFDDLAAIHAALETARRQQQSLIPIEKTQQNYHNAQLKLDEQNHLLRIVPIWFAMAGHKLWGEKAAALKIEIDQLTHKIQQKRAVVEQLQAKADDLKEIYLKLGGNTVEQLKEQITIQQKLTHERSRHAKDYQTLTRSIKRSTALTAEALEDNQNWAQARMKKLDDIIEQKQNKVYDLGAIRSQHQKNVRELKEEINKIQARPGSNIPSQYQDFRVDLAIAIGLKEEDLPFSAELIQVKPEENNWRGAIERAIGGHRLRILVPQEHLSAGLKWVNQRDNRLHVRLLEAKPASRPVSFFEDGFIQKLQFKSHPLSDSLKFFLAGIDRHCVDTPDKLRKTSHAMTQQGLMSGKVGQFEKQDQCPLNKGWMTGFDNKDRLISLRKELEEADTKEKKSYQIFQKERRELETYKQHLNLLTQLVSVDFEQIDLPTAKTAQAVLEDRLKSLTAPDSTAGKARKDYEDILLQLKKVQDQANALNVQLGNLQGQHDNACQHQKQSAKQMGAGLNEEELRLADTHLPTLDTLALEDINQKERDERNRVEQARSDLIGKRESLGKQLVRLMGKAKSIDTGALSDAGTDLPDIPAYLIRLKVLNEEALPQKLNRFLAYLNQSSDQGVNQLLREIDEEVTSIEERIQNLNSTLKRVDFQPERYLQLTPNRVVHTSLRTLKKSQNHLRTAALEDDQGESHYRALESLVAILRDAAGSRRTKGARALLDPRYRLHFSVSLLDRNSHEIMETRTGSQGGSGGEKEIIASYILTASLSYALSPQDAAQPLFGTIVLDEAFSKSHQTVAGRIISAIREFGLHPLFVTPNKEMRLLRDHTRSAIVVHRKGLQSMFDAISWERLEAHAQKKINQKQIK